MSTNMNDKSTKINDNEQNEQISTNTTKRISTNIWHKYLALAQLLFQVRSYYVQYYVKTHYMAPKSFQPSAGNAGTTNWSAESIHINKYQYISTDINTYQQICSNINKYVCISTTYQQISIHINKYQYISANILKYKQIWICQHINKYQYISTDIFQNMNKYTSTCCIQQYQQISIQISTIIFQ